MDFSAAEWIAIVGIILASLFALIQIIKKNKNKNSSTVVNQKSGAFSKGNQNVNISTNQSDNNE
jgi:hypothetical protein